MTERELKPDGNTLYTMWTGEGLIGPREGETLERYPALWGRRTLAEFLDEFAAAPVECLVMVEAPLPEDPCREPCARVRDLCGEERGRRCLDVCTPDDAAAALACVEDAVACDDIEGCFAR